MKIIPAATTVALTPEERQVLEALAGSRTAEARMRDRARIALLASAGMASRAIARQVGCTPGTASKWRVRYANDRIAGLSETGDRGNEPKYGPEHGQRILAQLDKPPPAGYSNWTAPLLARELVDIHEQHVWRFLRPSAGLPSATPTEPFGQLRPEDRPVRPQILVPKHGPRLRAEGR